MPLDLEPGSVAWNVDDFVRGEIPYTGFSVFNSSATDVTATFTSELYLSSDNVVGEDDYLISSLTLDGLTAGAMSEFVLSQNPVPLNIEAGEYNLILVVDVHNQVIEDDEENNIFYQDDGISSWPPVVFEGEPIDEEPIGRTIDLPLPFNSVGAEVLLTQPPNTDFTHNGFFAQGYDFDLAVGDLTLAIANSRIVHYRDDFPTLGRDGDDISGTGNYVTLVVDEGTPSQYFVTYMHLAQGSVTEFINQREGGLSATLGVGEIVGRIGASGLSSSSNGDGSHLHIQIGGSLNYGSTATYAVNNGTESDVFVEYPEPVGTGVFEGETVLTYVGETPVVYTSVDGSFDAGIEAREIVFSRAGEAQEMVIGSIEEHDGNTVTGFSIEDSLIFESVSFGSESLSVTLGSAILDVDFDLDGMVDSTVRLEGDFEGALFEVQMLEHGTQITFKYPGLIIKGGRGSDDLVGGLGDDTLFGGRGRDCIEGGAGDDKIFGGRGKDKILGGEGSDALKGGRGSDTLEGEVGDDELFGGRGSDALFGGQGNDELRGGRGNDLLNGGTGLDELFGGRGEDVFVFALGEGTDTVNDFSIGEDLIALEGFSYDDLVIEQFEDGTTLSSDGEVLAVLIGVEVTSLSEADFFMFV